MIMKWINGFEMDKWLNLDYKMKKDLDFLKKMDMDRNEKLGFKNGY